jgi:lipopolysaccharide export LptBFGC system permease protein LptF
MPDDAKELITLAQADRLLQVAAFVILIAAAAWGASKRNTRQGIVYGLMGPLLYILWKIFNSITDRLGVDSVANLFLQLGLFTALGFVAGILLRRLSPGKTTTAAEATEP